MRFGEHLKLIAEQGLDARLHLARIGAPLQAEQAQGNFAEVDLAIGQLNGCAVTADQIAVGGEG